MTWRRGLGFPLAIILTSSQASAMIDRPLSASATGAVWSGCQAVVATDNKDKRVQHQDARKLNARDLLLVVRVEVFCLAGHLTLSV